MANPLPCFLSQGLVEYHSSKADDPKIHTGLEEKLLLGFDLQVELFQMTKDQHYSVQHLIDRAAENADIAKIEQKHQVLLVTQAHFHKVTKTSSGIR